MKPIKQVDVRFSMSPVRTIRERDYRKLLRVVKAAEQACDWVYVHSNKTALEKMRALCKAVDALK